ncbi:MAG: hypothetical protein ABIR91_00655 [Candidatus Saccharimonadales bacterium]
MYDYILYLRRIVVITGGVILTAIRQMDRRVVPLFGIVTATALAVSLVAMVYATTKLDSTIESPIQNNGSVQMSPAADVSSPYQQPLKSPHEGADMNTRITINDKPMPIPSQGTIHKEIHHDGNSDKVDISVRSGSSDKQTSGSSLNVTIQSSSTQSSVNNHQEIRQQDP